MSSNRKSRLTRLEVLAQMALHAFPARYCRDAARPAATSAAYLDDLARVQILQKLAAMPLIERAILVLVWPPAMVLTALWLTAAKARHRRRRQGSRYRHRTTIERPVGQ